MQIRLIDEIELEVVNGVPASGWFDPDDMMRFLSDIRRALDAGNRKMERLTVDKIGCQVDVNWQTKRATVLLRANESAPPVAISRSSDD
jgi:hypothetical protein